MNREKFMKKVISILLISVCILSTLSGCCFPADDDSTLKADQWYHNDLVNYQNCVITDSFARNSGGVFVRYIPTCRECHEPQSYASAAIVSQSEDYLKTYYCDCGERTTIRISIY